MQLNETIARQIVERTMKIIPYSVNVMDELGRIIGSGDPARLSQRHEGAILAIAEHRVVAIDSATAEHLKGVKPGINFPIIYQDRIIGTIGISGEPDQVHQYGELVKMTAELIVEQAALMSQVEWHKRHREELVMQLIQGAQTDNDAIRLIGERLELDLSKPRIAAIVQVMPDENKTPLSLAHLQQLVHLLEFPERDNLVGILSVSANEVVVLKPIELSKNGWSIENERKRVTKLLKRVRQLGKFKIRIALGDYFEGSDGLSKSYQTAKLTLESVHSQNGEVFFYQNHRLPVLLSSLFEESWKVEQLREPFDLLMKQDTKGTLVKTLKAYFAQNCDAYQTSQLLHIHRNTLRYRLEQIEKITKLNINNLDDKLHLYLALNLLRH
ncbi:XRE family transcriptional regulator [Vibrio alfacsensis]|uniref:XRE family transcriptional regulator n=1 Tax=Vibrio alfacsensis TaxID=1074311 RepID=A0ABN5PAR3_9VIBR|nr:sugar diacid recognition domain-containing protein [Vibrio alfacsensis]AXY00379.1 XRE family transcriptional regulator [Vibrio alfacsensis]